MWNFPTRRPLFARGASGAVKYEVGIAAMYRILKKAGAERVSEESAAELRSVVEGAAGAIAADAVRMASHAGRKTVRAEDVRMASRDRGS